LYRLARQRIQDGKKVRLIEDRKGNVITSEESVLRWKEYFEELLTLGEPETIRKKRSD